MATAIERLKRYFLEDCLPVWADTSFGPDGHFAEALTLDGAREPTGIVRTRTAARQIYVFAHTS